MRIRARAQHYMHMPSSSFGCAAYRRLIHVQAGANQGLGYQTSLELAKRGATLYMVGGLQLCLSCTGSACIGETPAAVVSSFAVSLGPDSQRSY